MADTGQEPELLFFDTFSHESAEELNLDLVQFPRPVIIQEIRVIPLQTKVEADVPGGVRLGATNPSIFKLELFVNNLSKPNAATFESLGVLDYKENVNIQLKTDSEVPTDGLILKGWYNTITVAIYGELTIVKQDHHSSPPPPPPPQPRAKPQTVEPRSAVSGEIPLQEWETTRPGAKPPPAQHPLDYIQEQVNLQKKQQAMVQMSHPPPQTGPGSQRQMISPAGQTAGEGYRGPDDRHPPQHRDILQEFIQSPKLMGHGEGSGSQRDFKDDRRDREFDRYDDRSRDSYDYRKKDEYERSRENSHDRDVRDNSREREKERRKKEAWERFRKRENEKSRDYSERDWNRSPARKSVSRSRSRSRSRSYSRSPARSRTPRRSMSPRRTRSPRRSPSRSPRRSPRRQRSNTPNMTPVRSPEPAHPRSPSPSPQRSRSESFEEPPVHAVQVPTVIHQLRDAPVPIGIIQPPPMREFPIMPPEEEHNAGDIMDDGEQEYLEPLTPDQGGMFETSDGELQDDNYENISSDEDMMEPSELAGIDMYEITDELTDDSWTYDIGNYNPFRAEVTPLTTFPDISQTKFEQEKQVLIKHREKPEEAVTLLTFIEQFTDADHHAKWIESMESVPGLLPKGLFYLLYKDNRKDILDTLTEWTLEGLNLEQVISQPDAAYKVRHLKMGIRVAASLCSCDEAVATNVLSRDVQHKLLDIFTDQYTSFSVKLQIVQALDQSTRLSCGMDWLLGKHSLQDNTGQETCYQRILNVMQTKQVVRVMVALTAIIKKVHYYEIMSRLSAFTERVISIDISKDDNINNEDCQEMIKTVADITKVFSIAPHLISQPKRGLPGKTMFEVAEPISDPYPNLYHYANKCHLLQSLLVLISSPVTGNHPIILSSIINLLQLFLHTHHGLLYLSSQTEVTNSIVKFLIHGPDYGRDDSDDNPLQIFGVEVIHHLQTLQYIDQLNEFHNKEDTELDDSGALATLHNLYTMTVTAVGRDALVRVFSADYNIKSLLPFIELTGSEERDAKLKKSVCASYSLQLLLLVIRNSCDVGLLEKFSNRLVQICEADYSSKLLELQEWLAPIKYITSYNYDGVSSAVQQLKQVVEGMQKIPRPLITTCRILRHMTIPKETEYPEDVPEEIKYKYALLDVYGEDAFPIFITILQKVNDILIRKWQQGCPQSSENMTYYLAVVKPCLEIVKSTLCFLISSRGGEFKDLTSLSVLFELHTIMCSVPLSSYFIEDIHQIQKNVIGTLLAYTQPVITAKDTDEALTESLWTKTMKELIKYTTKAPYTYLSGLLMISELLPLPLPLQTEEKLTEEEISLAVNSRKLWSAHLHSLSPQIQEMIRILATSTCQPLQQVLRRVCWQLSDLSASAATMVTKCVLDMVVTSFETLGAKPFPVEGAEEGGNQESRIERVASPYASKMLNLLAFVLAHPPIKCATLHLMLKAGSGSDEKYGELLTQFLEILNSVCDRLPHVQAQECIVSIIQSLCDVEVSMLTGSSEFTDKQIAYSLPQPSDMVMITTALLDHMGSADHNYASILPCVKTLVMLTDHDYGFYFLKKVLEQKTTALGRLMVRINTTFSKDSSDCLLTLSTLLEFLRLLVSVESPMAGITVTRTYTLSQKELHQVLSWNPSMENHPLLDLEKLLEEFAKEDEAMKSLLDSMTALMKMLREPETVQDKKTIPEPANIEPESLSNLFVMRSVYEISNMEDERLNEAYWLSNPITDEADVEPDLIRMDMEEICSKYCPDYNLEEELKKTTVSSNEEVTKPRRLRHGDRRKSQEINLYRGKGLKRPFVAPMRGRGITRGLLNNSGRSDNFRCRPPNTSRPPSMHVDDFMKLEKGGNYEGGAGGGPQPGQPRQEDFNRRMDFKEMGRGGFRGRGFDRGRGNYRGNRGGGFFTPPGNIRSRDSSNNIYITQGDSGGGGGGSSGGGGREYDNRQKTNFTRPFSRGNNRPSFDDRRGRDFRFSPRGGRGGGGGSYWQNKESDGDRFNNSSQFYGRRDEHNPSRHVRSFTK
ncbi:protein virilizer homolog isoform X2 [Mytilus edulis]|uniref:protein virilizer homolog isoform X2 n=1 Tax=Mytilus edulis TaxID=6550 RepID=UPI0039EF5585